MGKKEYYNSRCSDLGKEAQGTSTPKSVCWRVPTHGLYVCAVSTICTVVWMVSIPSICAVVAILATILMRSIYHGTHPDGASAESPYPGCVNIFVVTPPIV